MATDVCCARDMPMSRIFRTVPSARYQSLIFLVAAAPHYDPSCYPRDFCTVESFLLNIFPHLRRGTDKGDRADENVSIGSTPCEGYACDRNCLCAFRKRYRTPVGRCRKGCLWQDAFSLGARSPESRAALPLAPVVDLLP
jgi:hypothetical protein